MEQGSSLQAPGARRGRLSGSNPAGVTTEEADELFELQMGLITAGVARMHDGEARSDRPNTPLQGGTE
jgi:hypothetical protein